jgi:hypothetical protein
VDFKANLFSSFIKYPYLCAICNHAGDGRDEFSLADIDDCRRSNWCITFNRYRWCAFISIEIEKTKYIINTF